MFTSAFDQRPLITTITALVLGVVIGAAIMAVRQSPADATTPEGSSSTNAAAGSTQTSTTDGSGSTSGLAAYDTDGDGMVYRGGMHPDIIRDEPGNCPICGMELTPTPVGGGSDGTVQISPVTLQNIGVRTAPVSVESLRRTVRSPGVFEANPQGMSAVSTKVGGWIDELHVDYEGARVRPGQALFDIYSPELVATQEEYLSALRTADRIGGTDAGSNRLVDAAERRLAYWNVSDEQIERLRKTRTPRRTLTFYAQNGGTVSRLSVTEGEKISAGQTLMHISDLNPLWLMIDLYEQDQAWVDEGASARVELPYQPGAVIDGRVSFIYDQVDPNTRTVKARIAVANPNRELKPGMYATVILRGGESRPMPLVPQEAVVSSGEHDIVIRALGEGRFRPVPVTTGRTASGSTQILEGLDGSERVVTSAQFLIDSEARLQGALSAMTSETSDAPSETAPESMDSGSMDSGSMDSGSMDSGSTDSGARSGSHDYSAHTDTAHDDTTDHDTADHDMTHDSAAHGDPVEMTVGPQGFEPSTVTVPVGTASTLVFTRTTERTCATEVVIPALDIGPVDLPMNEAVSIEVTPTDSGTFTFACGMDMIRGSLVVQEAGQ